MSSSISGGCWWSRQSLLWWVNANFDPTTGLGECSHLRRSCYTSRRACRALWRSCQRPLRIGFQHRDRLQTFLFIFHWFRLVPASGSKFPDVYLQMRRWRTVWIRVYTVIIDSYSFLSWFLRKLCPLPELKVDKYDASEDKSWNCLCGDPFFSILQWLFALLLYCS